MSRGGKVALQRGNGRKRERGEPLGERGSLLQRMFGGSEWRFSVRFRVVAFVIPSLQSLATQEGLEGWGAFRDEKTGGGVTEQGEWRWPGQRCL